MGWGVQMFKWGYLARNLNLSYYNPNGIYKLFNCTNNWTNTINMQDAKKNDLYMYVKVFFMWQINNNKKD